MIAVKDLRIRKNFTPRRQSANSRQVYANSRQRSERGADRAERKDERAENGKQKPKGERKPIRFLTVYVTENVTKSG